MIFAAWRRLIGFCFRLLYQELAFTYDSVSRLVSLGHWHRWQRSALPFLEDPDIGVVLELAHGTGALQLDLLKVKYRTIAIDLSAQMGCLARRKLKAHGLATDFLRGDALRLPLRDASVSAIVSTFPTEFILHQSTIEEMKRVLMVNGKVVIVISGYLCGTGPIRAAIKGLYRLTGQTYGESNSESLASRFSEFGFAVDYEQVDCNGSKAQLIVIEKTSAMRCKIEDCDLEIGGHAW